MNQALYDHLLLHVITDGSTVDVHFLPGKVVNPLSASEDTIRTSMTYPYTREWWAQVWCNSLMKGAPYAVDEKRGWLFIEVGSISPTMDVQWRAVRIDLPSWFEAFARMDTEIP